MTSPRPLSVNLKHQLLTDASSAMREATRKAKTLDPEAFACRPLDARGADEKCQIRLNVEEVRDGQTYVVTAIIGSGPTWAEALEMAYNWKQETGKLVKP